MPLFFLDACSIILLVWDIRDRVKQSQLAHWLDMIQTYAKPTVSVIIVATRAEEKSSFQLEGLLQNVQASLCHQYPQIRCITAVSCTNRQGIAELGDNIFRLTSEHLRRQGRIPAKFTAFRDSLCQESKREVPVMFWDEFQEAASLFSLYGQELNDAAHFLLTTGSIFFQLRSLEVLEKETNFSSFFSLSKTWLGNVIDLVVSTNQVQDGIFSKTDFDSIWRIANVPAFLVQPLIDLLRSMELIFPIPDTFESMHALSAAQILAHVQEQERLRQQQAKQPKRFQRSSGSQNVFVGLKQFCQKFLVPAKVPEVCDPDTFSILWGESLPGARKQEFLEYSRVWRFSHIRESLWSLLMTRLLHVADCVPAIWRQGVLLNKANTFACVERLPKQQIVAIRVRTNNQNTKKRSEERRVGKECDIPCRSRWSPYH